MMIAQVSTFVACLIAWMSGQVDAKAHLAWSHVDEHDGHILVTLESECGLIGVTASSFVPGA